MARGHLAGHRARPRTAIGAPPSGLIRSAALTFAGVTLRLWLLAGIAAGLPFDTLVYPFAAWLCWLPNMAVAEFLVRRPVPDVEWQRAPGRRTKATAAIG